VCLCDDIITRAQYACMTREENTNFGEIIVSSSMITDHMPEFYVSVVFVLSVLLCVTRPSPSPTGGHHTCRRARHDALETTGAL
jgi:hypothetical protein